MKTFLLFATLSLTACSSADFTLAAERDDANEETSFETASHDAAFETEPEETSLDTRPTTIPDTGSIVDTGSPAIDSGAPDTFVAPADTGALSLDTAVPDTNAPDTAPVTCPAFAPDTSGTWPLACIGTSGGCTEGFSCDCAKVVARRDARKGYSWTAEGFSSSPTSFANAPSGCSETGPDRVYKLFMRKGETVSTEISVYSTSSGTYQTSYWESRSCTTSTCSGSYGSCGSSSSSSTPTASSHTASSDGWVSIVVSGKTASDKGFYNLKVTLTGCTDSLCGCG